MYNTRYQTNWYWVKFPPWRDIDVEVSCVSPFSERGDQRLMHKTSASFSLYSGNALQHHIYKLNNPAKPALTIEKWLYLRHLPLLVTQLLVSKTSPLHKLMSWLFDGPAADSAKVTLLLLQFTELLLLSALFLFVLAFRMPLLLKSAIAGWVTSERSFAICNRRSIQGTCQ